MTDVNDRSEMVPRVLLWAASYGPWPHHISGPEPETDLYNAVIRWHRSLPKKDSDAIVVALEIEEPKKRYDTLVAVVSAIERSQPGAVDEDQLVDESLRIAEALGVDTTGDYDLVAAARGMRDERDHLAEKYEDADDRAEAAEQRVTMLETVGATLAGLAHAAREYTAAIDRCAGDDYLNAKRRSARTQLEDALNLALKRLHASVPQSAPLETDTTIQLGSGLRLPLGAVESARRTDVIEVRALRGKGTLDDRCRVVTQYWSDSGELLAEDDPGARRG